MSTALESILSRLNDDGLLMLQDPALPSVATLVAGQPVRGSWWAHPRSHAIFRLLGQLAEHPDVLAVKLVSGKVTFLPCRYWPALLAVATAREPWQMDGLSKPAVALLREADFGVSPLAAGAAAKQLEQRLLVHGQQVHTESGEHRTRLERWQSWAERVSCPARLSAVEGKQRLEKLVDSLNQRYGAKGKVPWR